MTSRIAAVLLVLSLPEALSPAFGKDGANLPLQAVTTERVSFAPSGTIHIDDSRGDLTVEGWDRPEVEITVTKSLSDRRGVDEATKLFDGVRVAMERKSGTELRISTTRPTHGKLWPLSRGRGVEIGYEVHVPRDAKFVIGHKTGTVLVKDVTGDIEASCGRGDIILMLRDTGPWIDAQSRVGTISSDFAGNPRVRRYRLGESYAATSSASSSRIHLRVGIGGIAIKAVPKEGAHR